MKIEAELNEDVIESLAKEILKNGNTKILKAITDKAIEIKKQEPFIVPYTLKEVIKITKTSRSTLLKHINSGLLQCSKQGHIYRFTRENLENYLTQI